MGTTVQQIETRGLPYAERGHVFVSVPHLHAVCYAADAFDHALVCQFDRWQLLDEGQHQRHLAATQRGGTPPHHLDNNST